MKSFSIIVFFALTLSTLNAQVPVGQWQDYLSFYEVHSVEKVGDKIYAATDVGLFSYDTKEYVLEKITKLNGLSDVGISAIKSNGNSDLLMVGYNNGKIDIISNKSIYNIPDLFLKEMNVSKRINHIYFVDNKAFCSTDFGVVVVDINKKEISETYIIGENATNLRVNQMTATSDSVFVATAQGVLGAPLNSSLLSFYQTWKRISDDGKDYHSIVSIDNTIVASRANGTSADIVKYQGGIWNTVLTQSNFVTLQPLKNGLAIVSRKLIELYDNSVTKTATINSYSIEGQDMSPNFSSIYVDKNNTQWIGDASNGLVQVSNAEMVQIVPEGPVSNNVFKLKATANALYTIWGVAHIISLPIIPAECSIYRSGSWIRLTGKNNVFLKGANNLNDIAIDPLNENHIFISSARNGIFEIMGDDIIEQYTETNSGIEKIYVWNLVNGLVMDKEGNLFANNQSDLNPIVVKPKVIENNGSANNYGWYRYDYASNAIYSDPWLHQTIHTSWGHFWAVSYRNPVGLFIYDIAGTIGDTSDDRYRYAGDIQDARASKLLIWDDEGKEINTTITYIAEDKTGYIWVGTTAGILVYYRPRDIFNTERPIASRIKIARNDGSGNADYLLANEVITAIAVDGANRKWIGTTNGVYLVSSDGTETISAFNVKNSPLLSNNIKSITINPKNGEVFFGTDKGIVSYRGTATEGEVSYSTVKAFPNPVTSNYQGIITVTGLMENSTVSITDISGKIVYRAVSTGGQIVWNGKNVYNEMVASGVYLVFATDTEGSESMVTKIMVVR